MGYNTPNFPVHQQIPELTQTQVHWVGAAIQASHLLLSPSPPTFNYSQHQGLFKWVSSSHQMAKLGVSASALVLPINIQGWFPLGLTGLISLLSKDSQESSSTAVGKHQFFGAQLSLWSNSHIVHDYWKNHSIDYAHLCQQSMYTWEYIHTCDKQMYHKP